MRYLFAVALLLLMLPSSPAPVIAQTADCNPAPLYDQAAKLKPSGDAKKDITALAKLADGIRQANITCNGFKFEGKGNKPVGIVELPTGTWFVTVTTKGYFILRGKVLSGSCQESGRDIGGSGGLFNLGEGDADEGSAIVIDSKDCRIVLTTENTTAAWTLTFEPIS